MTSKSGFPIGVFLFVGGFVWIVFDNLALGLIFGLLAAAVSAKGSAKGTGDGA